MKRLKTYLVYLTSLIVFTSVSSISHQTQEVVIGCKGKFFTTDNLGNIYVVTFDNSIVKYSPLGNKLTEGNFKIFGNLSQLDASNPFELYLYYEDQQNLLILDNMLNIRANITMADISTGEVSAASRSYDNGIWYFDASSMKVRKSDRNLVTKIEGVPVGTWSTQTWRPTQIIDNETNVFLNDSMRGVCIYDVFGNYYKTIDVLGLSDFQVKKQKLVYFQKPYLLQYDYRFFTYDTLYTDYQAKAVRIEKDKIYTWRNDSLYIQSK